MAESGAPRLFRVAVAGDGMMIDGEEKPMMVRLMVIAVSRGRARTEIQWCDTA